MIGERGNLLLEKAKPIPKYKPKSAPSPPQPSTSTPDVSSSPKSPPSASRKSSAIPQLILSTLHKTKDDSLNLNTSDEKERHSPDSSFKSNCGSVISGVDRLSNSDCGETQDALDNDLHEVLNTENHTEAPFVQDVIPASEPSQNLKTISNNTRTPSNELSPAENVATDIEQSQPLRRTLRVV